MGQGQFARAGLAFRSLACLRGDRLLFEGLDLALEPGGAAVVLGRNGAGKSSLLRVAAGLLRPAAGVVAREGRAALDTELPALDAEAALGRALGFWARLDGAPPGRVAEALATVGLGELAAVPVRLLSSGQRRRAGLARLLAADAAIWLLDEPGNGLDAGALDRLAAAMARHRTAGGIVLAATHLPLGLEGAREVRL